MKRFIVITTILLLVLSACSKESKNDTDANDLVAYKDDSGGTVMVPKHPERIVVHANSYAGYTLALGVTPVGLSDFAMKNDYFADYIKDVTNIGDKPLEAILELKPDLIIAFTTTPDLEELEKIAPTVVYEPVKRDFKEQLVEIGKLIGKEEEADKWIADWNAKIEADKKNVQEKIGSSTISILGVGDKEVIAYGNRYSRGGEIIYDELELTAPEAVQKYAIEGQGYAALSLEKLNEYAGDYIFIEDNANFRETEKTAIWQGLEAVKQNRVFMIDETNDYFNDPISLEAQRKSIVESLMQ